MKNKATPQNNADQIQAFVINNQKYIRSSMDKFFIKLLTNATQHMGQLYPHYPALEDAVKGIPNVTLDENYFLVFNNDTASNRDAFYDLAIELIGVVARFCDLSGHTITVVTSDD